EPLVGGVDRVGRRHRAASAYATSPVGVNDTARARSPRLAIASCAAARSASSLAASSSTSGPGSGGAPAGLPAGTTKSLRVRRMVDLARQGGEALGQPARRQSTWVPSTWTARLASGEGKASGRWRRGQLLC